ncbi:MAG: hypothetical protein DRP47_08985 [Candidatus Zixiibacteriota bacterium]|nr:MAG: hypothetical protein DRP47_08985 [candidate division Zixibacteria bacterium]
MGLTLDESIDDLYKLESNGIEAFIDSNLMKLLSDYGDIIIDFVTFPSGPAGFSIRVGDPVQCDSNACSTCG